jgi:hypothetical protein
MGSHRCFSELELSTTSKRSCGTEDSEDLMEFNICWKKELRGFPFWDPFDLPVANSFPTDEFAPQKRGQR